MKRGDTFTHHRYRDITGHDSCRTADLPFLRMLVTRVTDTTVYYRRNDGTGTHAQFKMDRAAFEREYGPSLNKIVHEEAGA